MRIVLDRNRGGSYLAFLLATLVMFTVFLFLTYYFQQVLGYSALKAGVAFLPFPVGVIISSAIASRTLPDLRTAGAGRRADSCSATLGVLWLTQLSADSSYLAHIVPSELLISLGMGQVFVPLSSTALLGVPNHDAGVASALVNTMQQVGGSLGNRVPEHDRHQRDGALRARPRRGRRRPPPRMGSPRRSRSGWACWCSPRSSCSR